MRKLITFTIVLLLTVGVFAQSKPKSGYLGKRFMVCAEGSYFLNYSQWTDLLMSYNIQYGGNVSMITGRHSQTGISYNRYGLGAHNRYDTAYANSGRINGYQVGLNFRKYRKSKGGLAPIGKYFEVNLFYHSDEFIVNYKNLQTFAPVIATSTGLSGSIGLGSQGIFWNRVVMNSGVRFGGPIVTVTEEEANGGLGGELSYMNKRLRHKDFFSAYFGIGIIF